MHGPIRPLTSYALLAPSVVFVVSTTIGCNTLPRSMSFGLLVEEAREPPDVSSVVLLQPAPPDPRRHSALSHPESPVPAPPTQTGSGSEERGSVELRRIPGRGKLPAGEPAPRPLPAEKTASVPGTFRAPETLGEELAKEMPERMTLIRVAGLRISVPYSWLADPYSPETMDFPAPYEFR